MVVGFHRTPEAEKSWADRTDLPYEDSPDDAAYKRFLELTKRTPKEKRRREILSLTRKAVGTSGKEVILWGEREIAFDGLGNEMHFFRSMGLVPQPVPILKIRQIPDTLETETYTAGISQIKVGYSTPFSTKTADDFYKSCVGPTDEDLNRAPTEFAIEVGNIRLTVDSFELWRNSSIEKLRTEAMAAMQLKQQQQQQIQQVKT